MDYSIWSQPSPVFGVQSSVFSQTAESWPGLSSLSPDEFAPRWIGANGVGICWVTPNSLKRNDGKVADTHDPEPIVGEIPTAAMIAWNRIRLALAIAPFQSLVRPACEVRCISTVVSDGEASMNDGESSMNVFRHVAPLGRHFDPDEP